MSDRVEDYRNDWEAGPPPLKPRRLHKLVKNSPGIASFAIFLIVLSSLVLSYQAYLKRETLAQRINDFMRTIETRMEMAVGARILHQYKVANNGLPRDPVEYLAGNLKKNKPFPPGSDFWGKRYLVEPVDGGFQIRSAGPDRKYDDADDLIYVVKY